MSFREQLIIFMFSSLVAPKITARPSDITVQSGNTISFKCQATGDPKPTVTWKRNNIQVRKPVHTIPTIVLLCFNF